MFFYRKLAISLKKISFYICKVKQGNKFMYSPELMKYLINYQTPEQKKTKKHISYPKFFMTKIHLPIFIFNKNK